jgi:hypothetical protein
MAAVTEGSKALNLGPLSTRCSEPSHRAVVAIHASRGSGRCAPCYEKPPVIADCCQRCLSGAAGGCCLLYKSHLEARRRSLGGRRSRRLGGCGSGRSRLRTRLVALSVRADAVWPTTGLPCGQPFVRSTGSPWLARDPALRLARAGGVSGWRGGFGCAARLLVGGPAPRAHCVWIRPRPSTGGRTLLGWFSGSRSGGDASSGWLSQR